MKSGAIILLDRSGERVRSAQYKNRSHRRIVINKWAEIYGERFKKCSLLICPVVDELLVNADGTNMRREKMEYKHKKRAIQDTRKLKPRQSDEGGNRMSSHLYIN